AHAAIAVDHADAVVPGVGHVHATAAVHRHAHRRAELRQRAIAVAEAGHAGTGQRSHPTVARDLADGVVAGVGDIEVAEPVDRQRGRRMELRRAADAVGEAFAGSRERADTAIGRDAPDAVGFATVG